MSLTTDPTNGDFNRNSQSLTARPQTWPGLSELSPPRDIDGDRRNEPVPSQFGSQAHSDKWYEDLATDYYVLSRIVIANANTTAKIRRVYQGAGISGQKFHKDLANLLKELDTKLDKQPLIKMFSELKDIGLDNRVATQQHITPLACEEDASLWRDFAELLDPASLRSLFTLPEDARELLTKAATMSAQALSRSQFFINDVEALRKNPAPRVLSINPDEHAQAVMSKITSTLYAVWDQTVAHALRRAHSLYMSQMYLKITGLTGHISPSLLVLSANNLVGLLVSDFNLSDHIPRLLKVCTEVHTAKKFASAKVFKQLEAAETSDDIQRVLGIMPALQAALTLRQREHAFTAMSHFAATIPDDKVLPLNQRNEMFKYESRLALELNDQTHPFRLHCGVGPHNRDLKITFSPHNHDRKKTEGLHTAHVGPNGEITIPELLNFMPITDADFHRMFPTVQTPYSISETFKRIAGHALFVLKSMQEAAPTLLCRVQELPKFMVLEWFDDALMLTVSSAHLEAFFDLFKYDDAIYNKLRKAAQPGDNGEQANPDCFHCFTIKVNRQCEDTQPEPNNDSDHILPVSEMEVELQRSVASLLHQKVHSFPKLMAILEVNFGVTITEQGKGSHKMANREGFRFTLSPKYRDSSEPLNIPITMKLIKSLKIPMDQLKDILDKAS